MAGGILALPAISFTTIFAIRRYLNFALAGHMTIGAYAGFFANVHLQMPTLAAVAFAFLVAGLIGVISDHLALRPLSPYGALTVAIASIALNLVLENVVRFLFGNSPRNFDLPVVRDWIFGPIRVGPQQLENLLIACAIMTVLFLFLALTPAGKAMRAVGDNPALADIKGMDPEQIGRLANFVAMGLGGVGGVLFGLETAIEPEMGFR